MDDLLGSVRRRYGRTAGFYNLSTLAYRTRPLVAAREESQDRNGKSGFFDFMRPQISGISKKLHEEIAKLFERREKNMLQTVSRDMPRLIKQHTLQWQSAGVRAEKARSENMKRSEKRVDLFVADTNAKMKTVRRELERLQMSEKARRREQEQTPREDMPLSHREAKRIAEERAESERAEIRRELGANAINTERRILRRLRDEEEYEKRRSGG
jgi:hypothetical protein